MNILLIQPPCVVSSQVTELYIHINSKFSKSNCQALTPFLIFLQCKGVRNLEYESRDNIQRPGSNWRLYLIFNSSCGFFILLIVSFSSKCCFDSLQTPTIFFPRHRLPYYWCQSEAKNTDMTSPL